MRMYKEREGNTGSINVLSDRRVYLSGLLTRTMRFPLKVFRARKIWMLISLVGIVSLVSNLSRLSGPFGIGNSFSKYSIQSGQLSLIANEVARNIDPSAHIPSSEIQHIAFLKVHKAASSTAQNIFLRFGWDRNLTFVLSPAKNPSGYPNIISLRESLTNSNILPPPPDKHFDILCNHVFYTNEAFKRFMPEDTVYIGIVREPFELYKSILNYFRPRYIYAKIKGSNPASEFLKNPAKYEPKGRLSASWTNNRMAIEFGFPEEAFKSYNKTLVDAYLKKIGEEFKIVIVAEFFEESVIIMRRILRWQTKDIIYVDQNVSKRKNETLLSKAFDRDFYKNYAKIDYDLYNFFYKRLKEQIRMEGEDFDDELLAFKELRKMTKEYCNQIEVSVPMVVERTRWSERFTVSKTDCGNMKRFEIDFVTRIRIQQYGSKDI